MGVTCPSCGSERLEQFYELTPVPAQSSHVFRSAAEARACPRGDVRLAVCLECGFATNTSFDASLVKYGLGYEGGQSHSTVFRRFQEQLAGALIARHGLHGKSVIDIGCGHGEFLAALGQFAGVRGVGIDPAGDISRLPSAGAGVQLIRELYSAAHTSIPAALVCCRHTLEHVPDVKRFAALLQAHAAGAGAAVYIEVPDTRGHLEAAMFWEIGYEHCSYFTEASLRRLLRAAGMEARVSQLMHAGQYICMEATAAVGQPVRPPEADDGPAVTVRLARGFDQRVADSVGIWQRKLARARRWVSWGSGSKFTWFVSALGLERDCEIVTDINPHRHGGFTPASGARIVPPEYLKTYRPDAVVVLNPAYIDEIGAAIAALGLDCELLAPGHLPES